MKKLFIFFAIILLCSAGCSSRYLKNYEVIHGRNFTFQKIKLEHRGIDSEKALEDIKSVNIPMVMKLLEHQYSVTIDSGEFELFIFADDPSKLKEEGLLGTISYEWENPVPSQDFITMEYSLKDNGLNGHIKDMVITFYADGEAASRVFGSFLGDAPTLNEWAVCLGYTQVPESSGLYQNTLNKQIIDLGAKSKEDAEKQQAVEMQAEKDFITQKKEITTRMKEHYTNMPTRFRERYKKDLIEFIDKLE